MSSIIEIRNVTKEFKVLNRREGLKGSIKDLFSRDYKTVTAVNNISMSIEQGEIVGYLGPNGAGKSTTIKMMTGVDRLPVLGTRQCNSTNAAALQADGCGVPILIDEIDNRFLTNMETTIKTVNQVCEQQQNNQIPLLIFASNDATAPKSTLLKRMAFFNPEGTMPSNVDLSECDSIGKFMIKNASNALYREYLHRMIPKIWELIKQADSEVKKGIYSGWYPDASYWHASQSSGNSLQRLSCLSGTLQNYVAPEYRQAHPLQPPSLRSGPSHWLRQRAPPSYPAEGGQRLLRVCLPVLCL